MKKYYAFDRGLYNPYKCKNAKIFVNKAEKINKVFFTEDFFNQETPRKWEVRYDNAYPSVFYDPEYKKYRVYYSTFSIDKGSSDFSLEKRKKFNYVPAIERIVSLCYAESEDGIHWKKPNLGIIEFEGSTNNNIIGHYLHGTSVFRDEFETDSNKRYKMFTKIDYGNGIHYLAVSFSKDGLHFDNFIRLENFNPRADTHNSIFFDPSLQKYVLVTREWRDSMRVSCISFSDDFVNWTDPQEILYPRGYENQIYSMPIFIDGDYRIGLPSIFHEGDTEADNFDTVDLELAYTYLYRGWNYVDPDNPFIDRGAGNYQDGEFDNSVIFSGLPIIEEDYTYFYYMGGNGQHTNFRETSFSRARIQTGRYAYISPKQKNEYCIINTNGFVFLNKEFNLDAEIESNGSIEIKITDFAHNPIDDVKVSLEKVGDLYRVMFSKELNRQIVRLSIKMKNAKIYSFLGDLETYRVEDDNSLLRL